MSPPIFTPDGSEVTEIVLPDGSTASEVVAPDGSVVFDSGPDIPDSVVLQYYGTSYNQGDSSWTDDAGNSDMTISGDPQEGTLSDGSDALIWDDTDESGTVTPVAAMEGASLNSFAIEFALEYTSGDIMAATFRQEGINQRIDFVLNVDESFSDDDGNIFVRLQDQDGDEFRCAFDTYSGLNDGVRKNLSIIIDDASQNNVRIIVDGDSKALTFSTTENPSNFGSWSGDIAFFADVQNNRRYFNGGVGAVRWHDEAISSQTIGDY
jgi:hypothetical protein